jgi:erythromycin esterase-like protein
MRRVVILLALLLGFGCSIFRPDRPRLNFTSVTGAPEDYVPLVDASSATRFVLLGESTHGTREFIDERARIVKAIADSRPVLAVVFEADAGEMDAAAESLLEQGPTAAVESFRNYPQWPWRSESFRDALESLETPEESQQPASDLLLVGFDFHGFQGVIDRMNEVEAPSEFLRLAAEAKSCFAQFESAYSPGAGYRGPAGPCSSLTASLIVAAGEENDRLRRFRLTHLARTLRAAERYHLAFAGVADPWTVREEHMLGTLIALDELFKTDEGTIVVWAHNTHVGDARVTSFRPRPTLGQLLRERLPGRAYLVGMTTGRGRIWAARAIGSPPTDMKLNPPLSESVEHMLARACRGDCLVTQRRLGSDLNQDRAARAIGLVYRPGDELRSHYIRSIAARQFDAIVYLDESSAVGDITIREEE